MNDQIDAIHTTLTEVDEVLRERLKVFNGDIAHILVAIGLEGAAIVRGNVDPGDLKKIGAKLIELAEEEIQRRQRTDTPDSAVA